MTRREAPVSPPVVLTIAGSDSGGGAGIQADLKTIEACGGFGTSAITSVTAQNTRGVQDSHLLPVEEIDAQIAAVREDFDLRAVKTGMLATSEVIDLVADHAAELPNLVVDPVMVAASGDRLLAEAAEDAYETLIAEATLVTPNADEAAVLTDVAVEDTESAERAGRILVEEHGAAAALVKGGHLAGEHVQDTLVTRRGVRTAGGPPDGGGRDGDGCTDERDGDPHVTTFRHDRVDTDATHGSGCTLSSAIATRLAHGADLPAAVGAGIDLLARAVRYNLDVGEGPGAVHHLVERRNDASRDPTVALLDNLATRFRREPWARFVPPSGVGLVGATPHAEDPTDVAGIVDRLDPIDPADGTDIADDMAPLDGTDVTDDIAPLDGTDPSDDADTIEKHDDAAVGPTIRFSGDDALASVLLAAREVDPALRFAALVGIDRTALGGHDETTIRRDGLADHVDDPGPIPAAKLAPLASAARAPAALTFSEEWEAGGGSSDGGSPDDGTGDDGSSDDHSGNEAKRGPGSSNGGERRGARAVCFGATPSELEDRLDSLLDS